MPRTAVGALLALAASFGVLAGPAPDPAGAVGERWIDPVFADVDVQRGLVFGSSVGVDGVRRDLRLDLFAPVGDTLDARPVIVWAHGGGFTGGTRASSLIVRYAEAFARRGYVTVSVDYRTRPDVSGPGLAAAMTDAGEDIAASVRWLRAHAATHRIDPARVVLAGYSAGAIGALVAALGTADAPGSSGSPDHPSDVAAAVSLAGFAPGGMWTSGQPPVLVAHGTADPRVPYALGANTCQGLLDAGSTCELLAFPGTTHDLSGHRDEITATTASFLARHVLPTGPPGAVREVTARTGHGAALVRWRPPGTTGGQPLIGIDVRVGAVARRVAPGATELLVPGAAPPGGAPTVDVVAVGPAGEGPDRPGPPTTARPFAPFTTASALVQRVLTDVTGRAPPSTTVTPLALSMSGGTRDSETWVEQQLSAHGWAGILDPVTRLYGAVLDRRPDAPGFGAWLSLRRSGRSVEWVASSFCQSPEMLARFGPPRGEAFVTRLYENVLGRPPDAPGLAYWVDRLASGTPCGRMVLGFTESPEHRTATATAAAVVSRWFGLHGTIPSAADIARWEEHLAGRPLTDLVLALLLSPDHPDAAS